MERFGVKHPVRRLASPIGLLVIALLASLGGAGALVAQPCPTIDLSPGSLPSGTTATPYDQTITASGGTAPYTFAILSGSLPPGLDLSSTGALTGSPSTLGTFNFVVLATDSRGCTGTRNYSITVACSTVGLAPTSLPLAMFGAAYSQTITGSGGIGPYTFTVASGSLPTGLTLSSGGSLSGTPATVGTFNFVVLATDSNGCTGTRSYSITVVCGAIALSPSTLPGATVLTAYDQTITASAGTPPYTFAVVSGLLPAGLTLSPGGSLTGTPTLPGTSNFVVQATDLNGCTGTRSYSITVACATIGILPPTLPGGTLGASYSQTLTGSGGTGPYSFAVTSGVLPAGITLSAGGALAGTPTAVGTSNFTVRATDANGCTGTRSYSISIGCPSIALLPTTLPSPTVGVAYSQTITGSGGVAPYSFAVTSGSVPTGLTLSSSGVLSGTPTTVGLFTFIVTATDVNGCAASQSYSVSVGVAPCPAITLSPSSLPAGVVGTLYSQTISASGGAAPYTFTLQSGTLPAGLTLSSAGVLSGTPVAATTSTFFVTATDENACTGTRGYTLSISCPAITITPPTLPAGTVGTAYNVQLTATGSAGPFSFAVTGGALPPGLSLTTAGVLSGSPTAAGHSAFTIVATAASGCRGTAQLTLDVSTVCEPPSAPQGPTIVPDANPSGPVTGIDFLRLTWTPPATGGAPSGYEWALNGDPFASAGTSTSVVAAPRGNNDPIQLHVRAIGCSPGPAADSPVYSPVPPSAGFSTPGPAAVGSPVTFTDTSDPQATSWLWLFGDGQIATTQSATHAFTAAGTYTVVLIASNGAGSSMALHTQSVQAAAMSVARRTSVRAFDPSEPGRQRIDALRLSGPRRTWLHAAAPGAADETILYLRFLDAGSRLVLERRLSVAAGQEAVYDLGAFGLRGEYSVEAVSPREVDLAVIQTGPREPAKRRDP